MYLLDTSALIVHMFNSQTYATLSKEAAEIVQTAEHLFRYQSSTKTQEYNCR